MALSGITRIMHLMVVLKASILRSYASLLTVRAVVATRSWIRSHFVLSIHFWIVCNLHKTPNMLRLGCSHVIRAMIETD